MPNCENLFDSWNTNLYPMCEPMVSWKKRNIETGELIGIEDSYHLWERFDDDGNTK
jgi:hypothetical protein